MKGKPSHLAYVVEPLNENEGFWTCIGAVFAHKDQRGFNLVLRALPVGGRIVLRRYTEKPVSSGAVPEVEVEAS